MKLAIVGSRTFDDFEYLKKMLEFHECTQIVSGGATGADRLAKKYALEMQIAFQEYLPNWLEFGKQAGFLRNKLIVDACDELVAFWDGVSRGTKHSLRLAEDAGKPVYIYWSEPKDPLMISDDDIEGIGV